MKKKVIYIILLSLQSLVNSAQESYYQCTYNTNHGLATSYSRRVFQDSRDFIWVGTNAGISRFDGRKFINYSNLDGFIGLISTINEDEKGNMWFGTEKSLYKFDGIAFTRVHYDFNVVNSVCCISDTVWIATKDGLVSYAKGTIKKYSIDDGLPSNKVTSISKRSNGQLLIGTNKGLCMFDNKFHTVENISDYVYTILEDKNKKIWYSNLDGEIFMYDGNELKTINKFTGEHFFTTKLIQTQNGQVWGLQGLYINVFDNYKFEKKFETPLDDSESGVLDLIQDREGNYWEATTSGLIEMKQMKVIKVPLKTKEYKMKYPTYDARGIFHFDNDSNTYITSSTNIYKLNKQDSVSLFFSYEKLTVINNFQKINNNNYLIASAVGDIIQYSNGIKKELYNENSYNSVNEYLFMKNKSIFSENNSIIYIDSNKVEKKYQIKYHTYCMTPINDTILIGSDIGLFKFFNGTSTLINPPSSIESLIVKDIQVCKDGTYLLATKGYGLLRIKLINNSFKILQQLNTNNGLNTNHINRVILDSNTVWLTSYNGIYKIEDYFHKPAITHITPEDGLYNNSWSYSAIYVGDDGYVYVGGNLGLNKFHKNTNFKSSVIQKTYITQISINNNPFKWKTPSKELSFLGVPQSYVFKYTENSIRFDFTGINLYKPTIVKYEYILEGYKNEKVITYNDNLTFNNLAPGNYTFKVRSTTNGEFDQEPYAVFHFQIKAPFWLTWWFITLCILFVAVSIYSYFSWWSKQKIKKHKLQLKIDRQLNEGKISAFQARMNPHFIFNSLNSIQYFITKDDKISTLNYLSNFAKLLRQTLDSSIDLKNSLEKEIEILTSYIKMEELRFENQFTYTITVNEDLLLLDVKIPSMVIQPFVENAILHGLLHREKDGKLTISFAKTENQVICIVEDNGIGRKQSAEFNSKKTTKHNSHGTSIAIQRLTLLNDEEKKIFNRVLFEDLIENNMPIGTRVTIYMPIL